VLCEYWEGNLEATAEVFRDGWYRSGKEFRFLDALPRSTMGKGLRYELRKLALESADSRESDFASDLTAALVSSTLSGWFHVVWFA